MAKKKRSIKAKAKSVKRKKKSTRKRATVKRKPAKRRTVARKRKPAKRKKATGKRKPAAGRKLVKQVERHSVERVMSGKRKRRDKRSPAKKRKVVMAGRRHKVSGLGGNGMLIGLGIGAIALYLITKKSTTTTTPGTYTLPPLTPTDNYTRNTQSNDLINYAIAGGLAIDAIIKLIDRLNASSDQEVTNIYDRVNTTGDFSAYV